MRKVLMFAVAAAFIVGLAIDVQKASAQVYSDFEDGVTIRTNAPYEELSFLKEVIQPGDFYLKPQVNVMDNDDGYSLIDIGFDFEFNGEVYNQVWVYINGLISFSEPLLTRADEPKGLFIAEPSTYPRNVVAPYWGDHYLRLDDEKFDGWMPSEISYLHEPNNPDGEVLTIQWKNLNINDKTVRSSVGNFQVKLYKSQDENTAQGNIEFCYGPVGGNPFTNLNEVITRSSSVGIKGEENGLNPGEADYLNGLFFNEETIYAATNDTNNTDKKVYTNLWPPSGATDNRILFDAFTVINIEEWWGDGDVDFSKTEGQRHFNMPQNRFVTINDVRLIMRAVATDVPLDSIRRRAAYHGDVNHNGRFYYDNLGIRTDIPWRDLQYWENLPNGVSSIKRIFYQATSYDASLILHYLGGRIPELPWIYDDFPQYGKIVPEEQKANGIKLGEATLISGGIYQVPVYLNGNFNGPVSGKFDINAEITGVTTTNSSDFFLASEFTTNRVVLAGSGEFSYNEPIAYINVSTDKNTISFDNIVYNDRNTGSIKVQTGEAVESILSNSPNPFVTSTVINVTVPEEGQYEIAIFDVLGNKIKTILSGNLQAKTHTFNWDGVGDNGIEVESGVYIYKLTGDGISVSEKMILNK